MDRAVLNKWAGSLLLCIAVACSVGLFAWLSDHPPGIWETGYDWVNHFRARSLDLVHGRSPYNTWDCPPYPIWFYVVMLPIAVLPQNIGYGVLSTLCLGVLAVYVMRDKQDPWPWRFVLLALSYPTMQGLILGHIDALLVLALMLPVPWAMLLVSLKPLAMSGWMLRTWWRAPGTVKKRALGLIVLLFALSLALYPTWIVDAFSNDVSRFTDTVANTMQYVSTAVLGTILLLQNSELAWLAAGLMLTPHLNPYHLIPIMAYVYRREKWWVLVLVTAVGWMIPLLPLLLRAMQ